ncbi:hypothetical protein RRG08_032109 [Elysia crispata]|uniref:Uncharacterized protein n=1 Tax=Elysia crispata TaxID=231223 RepID=A0AAE0ZDI5_9GAST|nr:hypothetical protein RRG08_032109 [Elysia crispata]
MSRQRRLCRPDLDWRWNGQQKLMTNESMQARGVLHNRSDEQQAADENMAASLPIKARARQSMLIARPGRGASRITTCC